PGVSAAPHETSLTSQTGDLAMSISRFTAAVLLALAPTTLASAQLPTPKPPDTVFLEELTWDELELLIKNRKTAAIIGTPGTEQKGPHMAIGEPKYATE